MKNTSIPHISSYGSIRWKNVYDNFYEIDKYYFIECMKHINGKNKMAWRHYDLGDHFLPMAEYLKPV